MIETPKETISQLNGRLTRRLAPRFGEREAVAMVRVMWDDIKGYSPTDLIVKADSPVSAYMLDKLTEVTDRVLAGEPLQYVLGMARFYGMRLEVSPAVLIPRPETAALVDMIVDQSGGASDLRVLDVGTGSGCIAIALARNLPFAKVTGTDISDAALDVARRNASELRARVTLVRQDILTAAAPVSPMYDIVVSNPPYILMSEREQMDSYVYDHEPAQALFVPDQDPLRYYDAVSRYAWAALADEGRLYFELNPLTADKLGRELTAAGWADVSLRPDDQRQTRYLTAKRPHR